MQSFIFAHANDGRDNRSNWRRFFILLGEFNASIVSRIGGRNRFLGWRCWRSRTLLRRDFCYG